MHTATLTRPCQAGDPSTTGTPVDLAVFTQQHLSNPIQVENYRRALRSWFMAYAPMFERGDGFAPFDLEGSINAYEVLDDLLSGYIQQLTNQPEA